MHWLTWLGLLFIGLGTAFTILGQQIVSDESNAALQEKSDEITGLSKENIRLSSELSKISLDIAATVTGGESFCYLFPEISSEKLNTIDFRLSHMGEYPVYDVLIRIWDSTCLSKIGNTTANTSSPKMKARALSLEEWNNLKKDPEFIAETKKMNRRLRDQMRNCLLFQENIGTVVQSKTSNMMDPIYLSSSIPSGIDSQEYNVNMIARNGQYSQNIKIEVRNLRFHIYSKVSKMMPNSKPVTVREFESIDSDTFVIKNIK